MLINKFTKIIPSQKSPLLSRLSEIGIDRHHIFARRRISISRHIHVLMFILKFTKIKPSRKLPLLRYRKLGLVIVFLQRRGISIVASETRLGLLCLLGSLLQKCRYLLVCRLGVWQTISTIEFRDKVYDRNVDAALPN